MQSEHTSDLDFFIDDFLFHDLTGYTYLAVREVASAKWEGLMLEYPAQADTLKRYIRNGYAAHEVYLAPVLYATDENAKRENVKCTNVLWTEFDGNAPSDYGDGFEPSLILQSSTEGHHHVYWSLETPLYGAEAIENYTTRITSHYGADPSAWDATQVLRPPGTKHHKSGLTPFILSKSNSRFDSDLFNSLAESPLGKPKEAEWSLASVPELSSVIYRTAFTKRMEAIYSLEVADDRSSRLMEFAYEACELGLSDVEVFVLIRSLADRWGKFAGRNDKDRQLQNIVTVARNKYPDSATADEDDEFAPVAYDYASFMAAEVHVDWVVDGMLMERGNLLVAGESGIGKTQYTLELMKHIALGKNYLHYKVPEPKKICFLSLEMGHPDLQIFMRMQDSVLSSDEKALLAQNFTIIPHGEPWALNTPGGQNNFEQWIEQFGWDGVFIDSLGSGIVGNINAQEVVQSYTNFVDRMRNRHNIFWAAIHHTRKKAPGQNNTTQDDVYGDMYLVARASAVYAMQAAKEGIKVSNWKNRLARKEDDFWVVRDPDTLTFTKHDGNIANGEIPTDGDGIISGTTGSGFVLS